MFDEVDDYRYFPDPDLLPLEVSDEFINEYISSYDSRDFNVVGVGSVGIGSASDASLTIKHSENVPSKGSDAEGQKGATHYTTSSTILESKSYTLCTMPIKRYTMAGRYVGVWVGTYVGT